MHTSLATISSPEFINLQPLEINPLMSACEIKVLYLGENRNHTFISKEVATDMAKTLRGAPIVGYYKEEKEDFRDHGQVVVIDDEGIRFEVKTFPYGFVSPDAKVWFQEFEDTNEFGETTVREYLMTTGYLWTGQFEECKIAVEGDGKPHSMELDESTVQGHWETNKRGMDFYIINDAIFSKLCILGDDIEPCFEGSKIGAPDISASFSKVDDTFKRTLFTMMQDLKFALQGGPHMDENTSVMDPVVDNGAEPVIESQDPTPSVDPIVAPAAPAPESDPAPVAEFENQVDPEPTADPETPAEEPILEDPAPVEPAAEPAPEGESQPTEFELLQQEYTALQERFAAIEEELSTLRTNYSALQGAHDALLEFRNQVEDAQKDKLIGKFYMLSDDDDDKKNVIDNKANYSLEQIEEKLAAICFRKQVNFDFENKSKNHNNIEQAHYSVNLNNVVSSSTKPAWLSAVDENKIKSI